jgi:hypothetical protein
MKTQKAPSLYTLDYLLSEAHQTSVKFHNSDKYIPARSLGLDTLSNRIRLAWMVFTGKADAFTWPGGQ